MFVCFYNSFIWGYATECSFPFLYRLLTYLSTQRNRTFLNNRIVKTDLWTLRWNDWLSRWYRRTFNINLFMVSDIDRKFMHRKLHKSSYIQVVQICECRLISRGLFTYINLCCSSFICFFFVFSSCSRQLKPNTLFLGYRLCALLLFITNYFYFFCLLPVHYKPEQIVYAATYIYYELNQITCHTVILSTTIRCSFFFF